MGNIKSAWAPLNCITKGDRQKGSKKRKSNQRDAPPVAPMYDTVSDFPVYAVVDKTRKNNHKATQRAEENVQYAEIEVFRSPPKKSQRKVVEPKAQETTEYATLNFTKEYNPVKGTLV